MQKPRAEIFTAHSCPSMILLWMLPLIFAVSNAEVCTPVDYNSMTKNETGMKQCIAHCIGLIEPSDNSSIGSQSQTPCYYDGVTGKSHGCGTNSLRNVKSKVLICASGGQSIDLSDGFRKACDVVYFDIFDLNPKTDVVTTIEEAETMMEHADVLQEAGAKVIGSFRLWETSENLNRISAKADLREKFAARVMALMEQLQLDGLFLQWMWPACPAEKYCTPANPYKKYTIELISAIGKALKKTGRLFMMYVSVKPFIVTQFGDYYTDVMPYVDYFVLETHRMAGHWNSAPDFNFNLKLMKEQVNSFISKVKDPGFRHKLVITFNVNITSYELKTPTKDNMISSVKHLREPTKYSTWLKLSKWCKLVRPGSGYKVFFNFTTQNYAVKEDHLIVFDDVRSLKEKIDWLDSFGIGVHLQGTNDDDQNNECGCGSLPFIRTIAQLLKSDDCVPLPCF